MAAKVVPAAPQRPKPPKVRSAGVLLHPTSLPGRFGVGDLGPVARGWVDALARAQQSWWQILPLNPTGFGDSPYSSFSAFAGNPTLVSPDLLVRDGLVADSDLNGVFFPGERADFANVVPFKNWLTERAWNNFEAGAGKELRAAFETYRHAEAAWLESYSLFMAIKDSRGGEGWRDWPKPLGRCEPKAVAKAKADLAPLVGLHAFRQFLFDKQWQALKAFAHERGVKLIGDAPIFVAADSCDVWANPELFLLDADRTPTAVAGVPPDYFSETGQLWGNPLYDWAAIAKTGYRWWVDRVKQGLKQVDVVRLDHFRGFAAAWHVPAGAATAIGGTWVKGPGKGLFEALRTALGGLPLLAEDLGMIDADVEDLRDDFKLPGMRILQFAFNDEGDQPFLPHNYRDPNTVVYTGTHDNDTTRGWYDAMDEGARNNVRRYVPHLDADPAGELVRLAWASVADYAIAPLQDLLGLGGSARMNLPGRADGNWSWRFGDHDLSRAALDRLGEWTTLYNRQPERPNDAT